MASPWERAASELLITTGRIALTKKEGDREQGTVVTIKWEPINWIGAIVRKEDVQWVWYVTHSLDVRTYTIRELPSAYVSARGVANTEAQARSKAMKWVRQLVGENNKSYRDNLAGDVAKMEADGWKRGGAS